MFDKENYEHFLQNNLLDDYVCPICNKQCTKRGIKAHIKYHFGYELKIKGRPHTETTKQKLSKAMKKAHAEGKAHNIGESRWNNKPSYPEMKFMEIIKNEFHDQNYIREFTFHKYSFDFAWPHKKKYIEIDSDYHLHEDQHQRDINKDKLANEEGWQGLRFFWNDFCSNTKEWIIKIKDFIDGKLTEDELNLLLKNYNDELLLKQSLQKYNPDGTLNTRCRNILKAHDLALMVNKLIDANIDFTEFGWCEKVNQLLGIFCARRWIKRNAAFLLNNNTYQRKLPT